MNVEMFLIFFVLGPRSIKNEEGGKIAHFCEIVQFFISLTGLMLLLQSARRKKKQKKKKTKCIKL